MTSIASLHLPSIGIAALGISGLPTAWNIVARNEYRRHTIEKTVKSKKVGAYLLAAAIFVGSGVRDYLFKRAVDLNKDVTLTSNTTAQHTLTYTGYGLLAFGSVLVVSSFLRLGITGTYLGDYFGILMDEMVTAFPFSHFENPMYLGATLNFLGTSLVANSPVGVALTGWVALVYHVSTKYFENPFTSMIYSEREKQKQ
ncbi:Phospholipid methyltransferase, putative [Angomonas deanei]|uniref:Phosphatidylethanolamine N-methyltransferase n=1 Tax=Angomonas deanei TaxID=59799 RepID=A0A7G2C344_9TRYP|nr:Phospholipid methyltransferase, putative [Angomonas deanei]